MQRLFAVGVAFALVASVACGKSEAERQAEQAAAQMEEAAKAAEAAGDDVAKGMEDFGKAMAGLAGAMAGGDGKLVEPVGFQALEAMLPEASGWERGQPESERMTSPFPFSQTEATYTKGDASIDVKIVDSGFAQMMIAPWSMMLATGYSRESSGGYEKAVTVGGQPAFEKWESGARSGELNVLVDKRFLVSFEGSDIADTKVLHEMAAKMDFGKFASLK